jgi:hypothetical protein
MSSSAPSVSVLLSQSLLELWLSMLPVDVSLPNQAGAVLDASAVAEGESGG